MNKRLIHAKQLNILTKVNFSYNDVSIEQDGDLVVLDKNEILELAQIIVNERKDQAFMRTGENTMPAITQIEFDLLMKEAIELTKISKWENLEIAEHVVKKHFAYLDKDTFGELVFQITYNLVSLAR